MKKLKEEIKAFEGFRDRVYLDSEGFLTCGFGHHLYNKSKITEEIAEDFLRIDLDSAQQDFWNIPAAYRKRLNTDRARVITHMIFNLGFPKVLGFKKMWAAILKRDYETAADEMLSSKWHEQVGKRAEYLADIMREGYGK